MTRRAVRAVLAVTALAAGLGLVVAGPHWITARIAGQSAGTGQPSTANGEWPYYTADVKGTKYSPLDQINASNFNKLEVAWRYKTDNLGPRPEYKLEGTPIMIKGVLYTTGGTRRDVVALDGKTGEVIWTHSMREGKRAAFSPRQLSGRGVSFWTDGNGDDRVVYVTTGYRLVELNAKDGSVIKTFGDNGAVDLKVGMVKGDNEPIDPENGEAGLHSTPLVVKNTIIVGSAFKEGMTVVTHKNTKGIVRAYDARTGKQLWAFHTIPGPGEPGNETWLNDSWKENGNAGVWTQMTVDEQLGLVYLPVEDPTSDYYGGHRPGNDLYGDSIVCVDLNTGKMKWYYQVVHHPIWDFDLSSAPILADIVVDGKPIKAVAVPSKQAFLYVFDRVTGKPVWPIEEKPAPKGNVPGEWYSPTQPVPTKPPAYSRNYLKVPDDVIDFTPQMHAQALEILKHYQLGPLFNPPILGKEGGLLGAINVGNASGGTNWPGAGYDPETHTFFSQAGASAVGGISLRKPPEGFSDLNYVSGVEGRAFRVAEGPGYGTAADYPQPAQPRQAEPQANRQTQTFALNVDGLPIVKPPYGVMSAINLDRGELLWQVPHGDTPDAVRNNPALKGMNIPKTGQGGSVGVLVTKTLVIAGDPQVTTTSAHPRGAMMRAYDKATGQQVGEVYMPAAVSGSPMTYSVDGKQYIVIAVSGGTYSGEYIAYKLPDSVTRQPTAAAAGK